MEKEMVKIFDNPTELSKVNFIICIMIMLEMRFKFRFIDISSAIQIKPEALVFCGILLIIVCMLGYFIANKLIESDQSDDSIKKKVEKCVRILCNMLQSRMFLIFMILAYLSEYRNIWILIPCILYSSGFCIPIIERVYKISNRNGEVLRNAKTGWYDSKLNEIYAMDEVIYKGRKCSIVKESNNFKIKVKEKQSWILKSFSDLNEETAPLCTIVYRGLYENM